MKTLVGTLALTEFGQAAEVVVGAVIFVILFTVILTTLKRVAVFSNGVKVTLAVCVSLLAIIGINRSFSQTAPASSGRGSGGWLDFLLLPYTAMAIAMLLVLLLLLLRRIGPLGTQTLRRPKQDICQEPPDHAAGRDARDERRQSHQSGRGE